MQLKLKHIIKFLINPPDEQIEEFLTRTKEIDVPKNTVLLNEGDVCEKIIFVKTGVLRLYAETENGEKNFFFAFDGELITEFYSFLEAKPAKASIATIENSVIEVFDKKTVDEFYEKYPNWERLGRLLAERQFLLVSKMVFDSLSKKPEEKYLEILDKRPQLIQKIPGYHLASYLGIKPETLSRIRKRI